MKLRTFRNVLEYLPDVENVYIHDDGRYFYVIISFYGIDFDSRDLHGMIPARQMADKLEVILEQFACAFGAAQLRYLSDTLANAERSA